MFFNFLFSLDGAQPSGIGAGAGRGQVPGDLKMPPESDTDSIADYADGENTGI